MGYDRTHLKELGDTHKRLRKELEDLREPLAAEIRAANAAKLPQGDIAEDSGYKRDQVRQICLPPEKRRTRAKGADS